MSRKLVNTDIYALAGNLANAMKSIAKGARLLKMDIARDLLNINQRKQQIDIVIESLKSDRLIALSDEFNQRLIATSMRIRAKVESEIKAAEPDASPEDVANRINPLDIQQLAEIDVKQTWPDYAEFILLNNDYTKAYNAEMRSECDLSLTAVIHEDDLSEDVSFENMSVLAYFFWVKIKEPPAQLSLKFLRPQTE